MNTAIAPTRREVTSWAVLFLLVMTATVSIVLYVSHIDNKIDSHSAADQVMKATFETRIKAVEDRNAAQDAAVAALDSSGSRQLPVISAQLAEATRQIEDLRRKVDSLTVSINQHLIETKQDRR